MKILVVSHTYCAAINRDKWKVLASLYPQQHLKVIFPKIWPDVLFTHKNDDLSGENLPNCEFIALDAFKTGNEVLYGYYPRDLIKILRSFKPDIIHVEQGDNAFSYFEIIALSRIFCSKAKLVFFTWINWKPKRSWKYRFFWSLLERFNLANSSGAFVGNQEAALILEQKKFLRPAKVLPQLGVDLDFFSSQNQGAKKVKNIVFVGRFVEEKGIFLLADAFNQVANKFLDWRLQFVGGGDAREKLKSHVSSLPCAQSVDILPPVNHETIKEILDGAEIMVLPSFDTELWKEQFGHIIIEAMAMKVPVIGSDAGEISNVIGDAGLVFKQKNGQDLAKCLELLMAKETLRKDLAERGYNRVLERYSHEAIAKETCFFWEQIMDRSL